MKFEVRYYTAEDRPAWDAFIEKNVPHLFQFQRRYMEYHAHKFVDRSLVFIYEGNIIGVFPAVICQDDSNQMVSHAGLTFGSFIVEKKTNFENLKLLIERAIEFIKSNDIKLLKIKLLPTLYQGSVAELIKFVCIQYHKVNKFLLTPTAIIDTSRHTVIQERRARQQKKAQKSSVQVIGNNAFEPFWNNVLIPNLKERFGVYPVHALPEIKYLHELFPENITQLNAYLKGEIVAGITLFHFGNIIKLQYISATEEGKNIGALDLILKTLMHEAMGSYDFIDMGTCAIPETNDLNIGLWYWKKGFGSKAMNYENLIIEL